MIDTHCHIFKEYYNNIDEIVKRMEGGIIIVSAAEPKDIKEVLELSHKYKNVYGTLGLHPDCADTYTEKDLKEIEDNLKDPKIVGIGEIGLDYHYTKENKEKQKELFIKQIHLANKYNKTLVIHTRDAIEDTYNILKEYKSNTINCDIHCFSSSKEMAKKFIDLGCILGIGGVLTFKNEKKLKEIVKEYDLSNFVLETDSPYLTPEPFRGKKNEPYNIYYVAKKIAELKQIDLDKVIKQTTMSAKKLYNLK